MDTLDLSEFQGRKISKVIVEFNESSNTIKFEFKDGNIFEIFGVTKFKTNTWSMETDKESTCMYCTESSDKEPIIKEIGIEMYVNSDSSDGIPYMQEEYSQTIINIDYCPKCGRRLFKNYDKE